MASVQELAPDLRQTAPRSPRETLAGHVIAARTLDKCRAAIAGTNGEYHFDCPLDNQFFDFAGVTAEDFRGFVETGATDEAVADWIRERANPREPREIIAWNNELRGKRLCEMPIELQEFLETYIPENLPPNRPVYVWFDVYDLEEGRM